METKDTNFSNSTSQTFNFLASLINGNEDHKKTLWRWQDTFNFLASLINGNKPRDLT